MKKLIALSSIIACTSIYANSVQLAENLYRSDTPQQIKVQQGLYLGANFLTNISNVHSSNDTNVNHMGYGVNLGYQVKVGDHQGIGLETQYSRMGNISKIDGNTLKEYQYHNISLVGHYTYLINSMFNINALGGYGIMIGEHTDRWMPTIGTSIQYQLTSKVDLSFKYQHYFGVNASQALITRSSVPSFNSVSVGFNYYL